MTFPEQNTVIYVQLVTNLYNLFSGKLDSAITLEDLNLIITNLNHIISLINTDTTKFRVSPPSKLLNILIDLRTFTVSYAGNNSLINLCNYIKKFIDILLQTASNTESDLRFLTSALDLRFICSRLKSNNTIISQAIQLNQLITQNIDQIMQKNTVLIGQNLSDVVKILTQFVRNNNNFSSPQDQITYDTGIKSIQNIIAGLLSDNSPTTTFILKHTIFDYISTIVLIKAGINNGSIDIQDQNTINTMCNELIDYINTSIKYLKFKTASTLISLFIANRIIRNRYQDDNYFISNNICEQLDQLEFYSIQNFATYMQVNSKTVNGQIVVTSSEAINPNIQALFTNLITFVANINSDDPVMLNIQPIITYLKAGIDNIITSPFYILNINQNLQDAQSNLTSYLQNTDNSGGINLYSSLANLQGNLIIYGLSIKSAQDYINLVARLVQSQSALFNPVLSSANQTMAQQIQNLLIQNLSSIGLFKSSDTYKNDPDLQNYVNTLYFTTYNASENYNESCGALVNLVTNDPLTRTLIQRLVEVMSAINGATIDQDFTAWQNSYKQFCGTFMNLIGNQGILLDVKKYVIQMQAAIQNTLQNRKFDQAALVNLNNLIALASANQMKYGLNLSTTITSLDDNVNNICSKLTGGTISLVDTTIQNFTATAFILYTNISTLSLDSFSANLSFSYVDLLEYITQIKSITNSNQDLLDIQDLLIRIKVPDGNKYSILRSIANLWADNALHETLLNIVQKLDSISRSTLYLLVNKLALLEPDDPTILAEIDVLMQPPKIMAPMQKIQADVIQDQVKTINVIKPNSSLQSTIILSVTIGIFILLVVKAASMLG